MRMQTQEKHRESLPGASLSHFIRTGKIQKAFLLHDRNCHSLVNMSSLCKNKVEEVGYEAYLLKGSLHLPFFRFIFLHHTDHTSACRLKNTYYGLVCQCFCLFWLFVLFFFIIIIIIIIII